MFILSDILTYIRRIIKSPSNSVINDNLLIDYVNRFWITDIDARMQLFDLKTKYQFQTIPGVDQYNMPLYNFQTEGTGSGSQVINMYPVYQGFLDPCYINGVLVPLQTRRDPFFNNYWNVTQNLEAVAVGNGNATYTLNVPIISNIQPVPANPPLQGLLRGHVDITGIISTGNNIDPPIGTSLNLSIPSTSIYPAIYITSIAADGSSVVVQDSGQFLTGNVNYGLLMSPGSVPFGYSSLGTYDINTNTINYFTGVINVTFPVNIPAGNNINVQCYYFQTGLPRTMLYYNNTMTMRSPPDRQYLVELDAYLSPAAFLNTSQSVQFGYMSEYIARGAARKILSDTGDIEQFQFYEPLFREQEILVWKRSQRQFTNNRTQTIYSQGMGMGQNFSNNSFGGSTS
jgi:hypothetical protein